ncbi:MAG: MBL fold metallo-hydrolase [candidate division KSB1 bacterium]|nr:MBL fold metallo-hydrolase [candidate division KSB1 bacterium]
MKLTVLGSGVCAVSKERSCASYYIEADGLNILMDIGFGALRRMAEADIDYGDVDWVVCTHLHLDHVADLAPLLMALRYTPGLERRKPLTIAGPSQLQDYLYGCRELLGDWLLQEDKFPIVIRSLNAEPESIGNGKILALPMRHSLPALGCRLEFDGGVIAYSGDTGWCDELIELCRGADLAILECSNEDGAPFDYHLTPSQAGLAARLAGVERLMLTHFYPPLDLRRRESAAATVFGKPAIMAEDLMSLTV